MFTYFVLSLKRKISAIRLVETEWIFLIFLITAVQISIINDRVSTAKIQLNDDHYATITVTYASTLGKSEQSPSTSEGFYDQLNSLTSEHKNNNHLLLVIGDFNSKTGSAYPRFSESMGKSGKGISNSNGEHLLEYAMQNNLVLTNTLFPHKMGHKTTWTSHERVKDHLSSDGTSRRNPYRNQIGYIICKNMHKTLLQQLRSCGGTRTKTDHKLVKATFKLDWWRIKQKYKPSERVNIEKLKEPTTRQLYASELNEKLRRVAYQICLRMKPGKQLQKSAKKLPKEY